MPPVLIACPTAKSKNYCFEKWIENVFSFTYPNFAIRLFDNSNDGGKNVKYMNNYVRDRFCEVGVDQKFYAIDSVHKNKIKAEKNIHAILSYGHNDCRDYLLSNNFEYLFHLESDVFPDKFIVESLMSSGKDIIGAMYYRDEGIFRKLMLQYHVHNGIKRDSLNMVPNEETLFVDGTIKQCSHVGLGCVLIKRDVLKNIKFRYKQGIDLSPDSFFAEDALRNNYEIFVDTSLVCRHNNRAWKTF
jgi:hypothetical protein